LANAWYRFNKGHCEKTSFATAALISIFFISVYYAAINKMSLLSNDLVLLFGISGIAGWIGVIWYRKEGKKSMKMYLIGLIILVTIFLFYPILHVETACIAIPSPCPQQFQSIIEMLTQQFQQGY